MSEEEITEIGPASEAEGSPTELEVLRAERDELQDKFLRLSAELDNARKRMAREKQELIKFANEDLLRQVLDVKDDLDRATFHQETADLQTLRDGLALIGRDLEKILKQFHVERIDAEGQAFDPKLHEAMAEAESPDHEPGTVIAQERPAYRYHERLLRPARVVVAKRGSSQKEKG